MVGGIALFGPLILYSAAGGAMEPWAVRQGLAILFFVAVAISNLPESFIKQVTPPVFFNIVLMLITVDLLGFVGKGARRWLDLGIIRLQPSEFMKPAVGLMFARFYEVLPAGEIRKFRAVWPAVLLIAVPAVLVTLQPDLGTGLMVTFAGIAVMFPAGVPLRWFLVTGCSVGAAPSVIYHSLHSYQQKRIDKFLDPESDPLGWG